MNILLARTKAECQLWTETAVVVDVLCTATVLCELLNRKKAEILLASSEEVCAHYAQELKSAEIFSDPSISLKHEKESPFLASKADSRKPALIFSPFFAQACASLPQAHTVLAGGFCNFYVLAEALARIGRDVLLVPASLFSGTDDVEDNMAAAALKDFMQGTGLPEAAVLEFNNTMRAVEYRQTGTKTVAKDLKIAFDLNAIKTVPQVSSVNGSVWVCYPFGSTAPEKWIQSVPAVPQPVEKSQEEVQYADELAQKTLVQLGEVVSKPEQPTEPVVTEEETPFLTEEEKTPVVSSVVVATEEVAPVKEETLPAEQPVPVAEDVAVKEEPAEKAETIQNKVEKSASSAVDSILKNGSKIKAFFGDLVNSVKSETEALERSLVRKKQIEEPEETSPTAEDFFQEQMAQAEQNEQEEKAEEAQDRIELAEQVTFSGKISGLTKKKKAIVLFSGGLDSTTCLYWALAHGYDCEALTVSYGQRHDREILAAQMIAKNLGIKLHMITLDLPWLATSSLVDKKQEIPDIPLEEISKEDIPSTYVPCRNLMFLSIAGSLLDAVDADAIIAGPNAVDFSGYPDCTPAFFKAAAEALNRGTRMGVKEGIEVLAPLMRLSKTEIVKLAAQLKVPFELTWSCYAGGAKPCGHCDSCKLRAKGFAEAGVKDTALG